VYASSPEEAALKRERGTSPHEVGPCQQSLLVCMS
jgi:hypothetical protein